MKNTKKILSTFLALLMIITIIPMSINASAATYTGTCGDTLTWSYDDSTYVLTISGTGAMNGYSSPNRPWESYEDSIKTVVIEDGVTTIGQYAFYSFGSLTSITIPDSVTSIGYGAFYNTAYYNDTSNWENNVLYIGNHLIEANTSISGDYEIEDGTITIADSAFRDCESLTSITIPDSVTSIGNYAFYCCTSLTNLTIPDSVTSIGNYAFENCTSLTSITIPDSVTSIGYVAFAGCTSLTSITIPDSVTSIDETAFSYCASLTSFTVDSNNQYYSSDENGVLFNKDKTILVQYPIGKTETSYIIPDNVTSVGVGAFSDCTSLTSITIPDGVTSIGNYAFAYCTSLTSVTIGDSVTSIDYGAFAYCTSLTDVYYGGTEEQWNNIITIDNTDGYNDSLLNATIHYNGTDDIYNLGEETYNFDNFGDSDSPGGHCFGMSMTSAAYYNNILDITDVGGNTTDDVYGLSKNAKVKKPICHYQPIQGDYSIYATVAGGSYYLYGYNNVRSDWEEIIDYVSNHNYDNKGNLQIGFRRSAEGGHAINFLRYEVVNGQERIYAYDNNFPDTETYFYKASNGNIYQAPYSTFNGAIDCIALRDVNKYFEIADDYDAKRYIYGDSDCISIAGAIAYPMECGDDSYTMFEIPDGVNQIVITPLTDGAEFKYCENDYSFGNVDDDTIGIFTLATEDDESIGDNFVITNLSFSIQSPSTTTISKKNGIVLHANVEGNVPDGSYVVWTASNNKFTTSTVDEDSLKIISNKNGYTTFTATLYDADGNVLASDSIEMRSKAGFFDVIASWFRSSIIYES